jgi:hypothetical protein
MILAIQVVVVVLLVKVAVVLPLGVAAVEAGLGA